MDGGCAGWKSLADVGNSQSALVIWWVIPADHSGSWCTSCWSRAKCQSSNELETEKGKLIVSIEYFLRCAQSESLFCGLVSNETCFYRVSSFFEVVGGKEIKKSLTCDFRVKQHFLLIWNVISSSSSRPLPSCRVVVNELSSSFLLWLMILNFFSKLRTEKKE